MRFILFFFILLQFQSLSAQETAPVTKANIQWGDGLSLALDQDGFKTSKNARVFASFRLKNEHFRSVSLSHSIRFPLYNMVLVFHENTIYILDLRKAEILGQFKVPSRGTPRFIKIEPHENGFTSLKVLFRMLPRERTEEEKKMKRPIGRPGPLITKVMIYKDGKYQYLKR